MAILYDRSFILQFFTMAEPGVDLKLVLLGEKAVGKTSIFNRYVYDEVFKTQMTIGAYFALKNCKIKERSYKIAIWDTAGEEKFDALTKFYTRGAHCAIICYDLTEHQSFTAVKKWATKLDKDCVVMILGNKLDLIQNGDKNRDIESSEVDTYATQIGALHLEGSAVSGEGIELAFEKVVSHYIERHGSPDKHEGVLDIENERKSKKVLLKLTR